MCVLGGWAGRGPPGGWSLCAAPPGARNRPFAALTPDRQKSFPDCAGSARRKHLAGPGRPVTDTISDPAAAGARNVTLADMAALLRDQQARKVDVVAPAAAIRARDGQLVIDGTAPVIGDDGVTLTWARTPRHWCGTRAWPTS
jgi:hypothetical protein